MTRQGRAAAAEFVSTFNDSSITTTDLNQLNTLQLAGSGAEAPALSQLAIFSGSPELSS
jgi:hypothetical protein